MVLAFLFIVALVASTFFFLGSDAISGHGQHRIVGGVALVGLSVLLLLTVRYWVKWLLGIVVYCFAKALLGTPLLLLSGRTNLARQVAFIFVYCLIAALLSWKYFEREPVGIEKVGLVVFVVCAAFATALQSNVPLIVGLVSLGVGGLFQRILRPMRQRLDDHGSSPISTA
jgi:hypothetical protein